VPSYISSFRVLPHGWRSLVLAAVVASGFLGGFELFWRHYGFVPTLTDSDSLWCEARASVAHDSLVILGSSRLQTGLDPIELSRALGGRSVVQLALAGANPVPALLDLAADTRFGGVVLLEYMPRRLFTSDVGAAGRTQAFVTACHNPSVVAPIEARLARVAEQHLTLLDAELQIVALLSYVAHHRALPHASHDQLRGDRYSLMSFPEGEHVVTARDVWDPPFTGAALEARFGELRAAIASIAARGGKVILYRSPVSGEVLADEEARFPSAIWFPRAARELGASSIDYAALPGARTLDLPDGEHPRSRDVAEVTATVGRALQPLLR